MEVEGFDLNYEKICRTCLSTADLIPIFENNEEGNALPEKVMECTSVVVIQSDGFPPNMCKLCIKQLNDALTFRKRCIETQIFLQEVTERLRASHQKYEDEIKHQVNLKPEDSLNLKFDENHDDIFELLENGTQNDGFDDNDSSNNQIKEIKQEETKKDYGEHVKESHSTAKRVLCTTCNKEFSINHIHRHMRIHTKEKPFSCDVCGKRFNTSYNRDRHVKTHTGERPHECKFCGKGFIQAVTLEAHLRVHTGETPFMCNYCGKTFKQSRLCRLHVQTRHINPQKPTVRRKRTENRPRVKKPPIDNSEKRFGCDMCDRRFITRSLLYAHKLHHGEKTFLCSECGKRFVNKVALKIHGIVHSGTKQYPCNICDKSFAYSSSLKTHLLRHSGEKRYGCHLCGSKFLQSAHLKTHLRLHEGVKPFKCSVCGKDFALKGNLTVHMRIHTGETPYQCPTCLKGFYDSSSMRKHHQGHLDKMTKTIKSE